MSVQTIDIAEQAERSDSAAGMQRSAGKRLQRVILLVLAVALLPFLGSMAAPSGWFEGLDTSVPLHIFIEVLAVSVSIMAFGVGWNAYHEKRPGNIILLACALLAVALLDLAHLVSFPGMPDFVAAASLSNSLSFMFASQLIAAAALLTVAVRPWQPLASPGSRHLLLLGSLALTALLYWMVLYHGDNLGGILVAGREEPSFMAPAEYLTAGIFFASALIFLYRARNPQPHVIVYLFAAASLMAMSLLSSAAHSFAHGMFNLLGHAYKMAAYLFIYHAVFVDGVREPYSRLQRSEGALKESEARFRAISSNIPGMVYQLLLKKDGGFLFPYVSEGAYALFGIKPEVLQSNPELFLDLILPGDLSSYRQSMEVSAADLTTWNWEGRIRIGRENEIKWINLRSSPRKLDDGTIQWEGIMSNITQSKLAESEIKKSRQELSELSSHIETAKEHERVKIAREVHDDIGGTLTAIKIDLMWLANRLPKEDPGLLEKTAAIETLVDRIIETTSRISRELRPGILEFGIVAAIEWQAEEFQKRMGIVCEIDCPEEEITLEPDLAVAIFRIFQETLTNISKYANASRVRVSFKATDSDVILEVADNGCGIPEENLLKPGSFGIRGMQERARYFGGDVRIHSTAGKGTRVTVCIPRTR